MPSTFTVIDVKTTGADPQAIRQIGILKYIDSRVVWKYTTRVDPDGTHTFQDVAPHIFRFIHGEIVVSYGPSARQAIEAAYLGTGLDCPESHWIDCQQVIRRTWPEFISHGDELVSAADMIRYRYIPGDALQESQAIGAVFLAAIKESGFATEAWVIFARGNEVRRRV